MDRAVLQGLCQTEGGGMAGLETGVAAWQGLFKQRVVDWQGLWRA